MARFDESQVVGQVVAEAPGTSRVFEKYGIDYCCGGGKPIGVACREKGIDPTPLLSDLEEAAHVEPAPEVDWLARPVSELLDHILATHHAFLRTEMPRLQKLAARVEDVHGRRHPELFPELGRLYTRMVMELDQHMLKEEEVLFPAIRGLEESGRSNLHCGHLSGPIRVMEWEHEECGRILERMRRITDGYRVPDDACNTFRALFQGLEALEADLHRHIHLENNLVHPRALAMAGVTNGAGFCG